MKPIARFLVFRPHAVLLVIAIVTLASLGVLLTFGVHFNGSPETLARSNEELTYSEKTKETFGDDRVIIVAVETPDIFTSHVLRDIDRLTGKLAALDGVQEADSLTNVESIRGENGDVRIERLVPAEMLRESADASKLQALRAEVISDPLYVRQLVSEDGTTAAINVFLKPLNEAQTRSAAEKVEATARSEKLPYKLMFAGVPIIQRRGVSNMVKDFGLLSPIAAVLCFVIFLLAFRTLWGAVIPTAALFAGLLWTLGLMSFLGKPITLTTLAIPTVLMAVGGSYFFHVLNQYRISMTGLDANADRASKKAAWLDGLTFISPAVVVSGTATMAGFGSLASSDVPTVRDMGVFNTFGVLAMLVLAVAFIPAALSLLPADALGRAEPGKDYASWLNRPLRFTAAFILFRRNLVLSVGILLTLVSGAGAVWLRIDTDYIKIFPRKSETVRDAEEIHNRLAGVVTVQLVVTGRPADAPANVPLVSTPQFVESMTALEQFALRQPGVDSAFSIADVITRVKSVAKNSNPSARQSDDRFDALKLLSEDESIFRLASRDFSSAVVILRTNLSGSNELKRATNQLRNWAEHNLPAGMTVRPTGSIMVLNDASDSVANSQTTSLTIAIVTIFVMMAVLFRSISTGLLALIPNLMPIIGFFGFLGWTGITLDITTSLIASAVLGLAVDNAVHIIRRYRQSVAERSSGSPEDEGWIIWLTMSRTGKPMVLANVMLILAFLVFVFSSFAPVRTGGVLWALTIAACLTANLAFLPALMKTRLFSAAALGRAVSSDALREETQEASSG